MTISVLPELDQRQAADLAALVERIRLATGRSPFNEETRLSLASPGRATLHVLLLESGQLSGCAVILSDGEPWRAQVAISPDSPDIADRLIRAVLDLADGHVLQVWTPGQDSAVSRGLERAGLERQRTLLKMARPLSAAAAVVPVPDGYVVRGFRVGADEAAWMAGNAAAFAWLPDQGGWGPADLADRLAQPWFDSADLLLLQAGANLAGFCWTKVTGTEGEIYVFAVLPAYQGRGLAAPLLSTGLRHMRDRGCAESVLFVDAANGPAVRLYANAGFRIADTDALFVTR